MREHESELEAIQRRIDRIQGNIIAKINHEFAMLRDDIVACRGCGSIIFGERSGQRKYCNSKCRISAKRRRDSDK